jgi:hypothetical protein
MPACLAGDRLRAHQLSEFSYPDDFPGDNPWIETPRQQVLADPPTLPARGASTKDLVSKRLTS